MASPVSLSSVNTLSSISRHLVDVSAKQADRTMLDLIKKTEQGKSHLYSNLLEKMVKLYPNCSPEGQKILQEKYDSLRGKNKVNVWFAERRHADKFKRIEDDIEKSKSKNSEHESEQNGAKAQQSNEPKNIVSDGQKLMSAYAIVSQQPGQNGKEESSEFSQMLANGIVGDDFMMEDVIEDMKFELRGPGSDEELRSGTGTGTQIGEPLVEQDQMIVEMDKAQPAPEYQEDPAPEDQEGEGGRPRSKSEELREFLTDSIAGISLMEADVIEDMEDEKRPLGSGQNEPDLPEVHDRTVRAYGEPKPEPVVETEIAFTEKYRPEGFGEDGMTIGGQQDYWLQMTDETEIEGVEGDDVEFDDVDLDGDEGDEVTIGLENDDDAAPEYLQIQQ